MKNKVLFTLSLLMGLMFLNAGLNKFFNYMPMPQDVPKELLEMFEAIMKLRWLMPLVGVAEIIGGILIMIPRFRALGALILLPVMVGIVAHHITLADYSPVPFVMAIILGWVLIENRERFFPIIRPINQD